MRKMLALVVLVVSSLASPAWAVEICGNSIDDDGNGSTDENCAPTLTTETPLRQ